MKIQVFKSKGQWYFHVLARNNKIIAASEGYTRKSSAEKTLQRLKIGVASAVVEYLP